MSIREQCHQMYSELVAWRRYLHQHPELSFHETQTQHYIMSELKSLGLNPRPIAGTGVVVDIGRGIGGVAIRADIDALPLTEEAEVSFRSQNPGVMHACGHDGHTAILLGVAKLLAQQEKTLPGHIRLMFQPAEEQIPGGARQLIEEQALEGIDRVLGLHLSSDIPTGFAGAVVGAQTANADSFAIAIEGHGGHASQPELTVDAVVVAAELVLALQTIVSRNVGARHAVVVTVGTLTSGSNFNIIAPHATLTGTVRTFTQEDRALVQRRIKELASHIARAHQATAEVSYHDGYPSVINTPEETAITHSVIRRVLGEDAVLPIEPSMVGEDFSYYQERCPGTFLMLGCANPEVGASYPHHHPRFTLDEESLPLGAAILAETALEFLLINPSKGKRIVHHEA